MVFGEEHVSNFTTQVYPHGPPYPPTNLQVHNATSFSVELSWTVPFNGGLSDMVFVVSYRLLGLSSFTVYNNSFNPSSNEGQRVSIIVHGLESNEIYQFTVASHNGFGGGIGATSSVVGVQNDTAGDF